MKTFYGGGTKITDRGEFAFASDNSQDKLFSVYCVGILSLSNNSYPFPSVISYYGATCCNRACAASEARVSLNLNAPFYFNSF